MDYYQYALFLIATAAAVGERSVIRARTDSIPTLLLCANHGLYKNRGHEMSRGMSDVRCFRHAKSVRRSLAAQTLAKSRFVEEALLHGQLIPPLVRSLLYSS